MLRVGWYCDVCCVVFRVISHVFTQGSFVGRWVDLCDMGSAKNEAVTRPAISRSRAMPPPDGPRVPSSPALAFRPSSVESIDENVPRSMSSNTGRAAMTSGSHAQAHTRRWRRMKADTDIGTALNPLGRWVRGGGHGRTATPRVNDAAKMTFSNRCIHLCVLAVKEKAASSPPKNGHVAKQTSLI